MLRSVRVYSQDDFDCHYQRFYKQNPHLFNERTAVCPFDMSGGSAYLMQFNSAHTVPVQHVPSLPDALELRSRQKVDRIILVDDAVLSGTQARNILDEYLGPRDRHHAVPLSQGQIDLLTQGEVLLLFIMGTEHGKQEVAKNFRLRHPGVDIRIESIAHIDSRALFKDESYVFDSMAESARKVFFDVGYSILEERAAESEETAEARESYRRRNAIGFGDDQLLIVYDYNIPKGTVTLLWERGLYKQVPWEPLFPIREPQALQVASRSSG
jgi:hypothetical protein